MKNLNLIRKLSKSNSNSSQCQPLKQEEKIRWSRWCEKKDRFILKGMQMMFNVAKDIKHPKLTVQTIYPLEKAISVESISLYSLVDLIEITEKEKKWLNSAISKIEEKPADLRLTLILSQSGEKNWNIFEICEIEYFLEICSKYMD